MKRNPPPPGAYINGKIYISSTTHALYGIKTYCACGGHHIQYFTAEELREAAHLFNQLAEYLECSFKPPFVFEGGVMKINNALDK